jgi:hypothetical protein
MSDDKTTLIKTESDNTTPLRTSLLLKNAYQYHATGTLTPNLCQKELALKSHAL